MENNNELLIDFCKEFICNNSQNRQEVVKAVHSIYERYNNGRTGDSSSTRQITNVLGTIYPKLDSRYKKDSLLLGAISTLDGMRYDIVQTSHTPYIREPLLLSDIGIARPLYWPGLDEGKKIIEEYSHFSKINKNLIDLNGMFKPNKVDSDFVVAYSLLRSDMCDFGEEYAKMANPEFLDRVVSGIVGMRFGDRKWARFPSTDMNFEKKEEDKRKDRLRELLPESLHNKIDSNLDINIAKGEWTTLPWQK